MLIGPDVSFYQNDVATPQIIDFAKMRTQTPYVFIRAGQNTWEDRDLAKNMKAAKDAGLMRGTYWFYDSRVSPAKQAELYVSSLKGDMGELPLVADLEENYKGPYKGWGYWYDFISKLQCLAPDKKIMIYTGYYYWMENAPGTTFNKAKLEWFAQFPLWIAAYGAPSPKVPKPWLDWTFWQYTDNGDGLKYGAESKNIDLNYFNGNEDDLKKLFNVSESFGDVTETLPAPTPAQKVYSSITLHSAAGDETFKLVK